MMLLLFEDRRLLAAFDGLSSIHKIELELRRDGISRGQNLASTATDFSDYEGRENSSWKEQ